MTFSSDFDEVLPTLPGNPVSPYRSVLAGRPVLDIWTARFDRIKDSLASLAEYGMDHCVVIIHNWQYAGYDNELPQHTPANPQLGGDDALRSTIAQAKQMDCLASVHENYADYYPNYPRFSSASLSLQSNGQPELGWLNTQLAIQSYASKPSQWVALAATQSPLIHQSYATTGSYIDVNSAMGSGLRTDMDSSVNPAGMWSSTLAASQSLWNYERTTHQGPAFGEGGSHWIYSGMLDGVEAQSDAGRSDWKSGPNLPLIVDFDLFRMHSLQVNHGMGYYSRWSDTADWYPSTEELDAYRMQEIAFGHAPYIGYEYWEHTAKTLVERGLIGPVSQRLNLETPAGVHYQSEGQWVNTSAALKTGATSRLQVQYSNGDVVVANSGAEPLAWEGLTIPQYGWAAHGDGLHAYSALVDGVMGDYVDAGSAIFANARNADDYPLFGVAQPSVESFNLSANSPTLTLRWRVLQNTSPEGKFVFVHFVNYEMTSNPLGIVFQADHPVPQPASGWIPGAVIEDGPVPVPIPAGLQDGSYSVLVGIWSPSAGKSLLVGGTNVRDDRSNIGTLVVSQGGTSLAFVPPAPDGRLNYGNRVVDFGSVRTDGMVMLRSSGKDSGTAHWELRTFPRIRSVTVELDAARFPMPATIVCDSTALSPQMLPNSGSWRFAAGAYQVCSWDAGTAPSTGGKADSGFSLQPAQTAVAMKLGGGASLALHVAVFGYYSGTLSFRCSGLPANTACLFSPATLYAGGDNAGLTTTVTLTQATPLVATAEHNGPAPAYRRGKHTFPTELGFGLVGIVLSGWGRGRRAGRKWSFVALPAILSIGLILSGCGGGSSGTAQYTTAPATPTTPATPSVTTLPIAITATGTSGDSQAEQTVYVILQVSQ
jgi:hypothetical protein